MPDETAQSDVEVTTPDASNAQQLQADVEINQDPTVEVAHEATGDGGEDLHELTLVQLRERLKNRDLPTSGNKDELVERLQSVPEPASDAQEASENGGIQVDLHANAVHSDVLQSLSDDRRALQLKGIGRR